MSTLHRMGRVQGISVLPKSHGCGGDGGLWGMWFPKENSDGVTRGRKNQCLHEIHRWLLWLPHGNRVIHQLRVLAGHSSSQRIPLPPLTAWVTMAGSLHLSVCDSVSPSTKWGWRSSAVGLNQCESMRRRHQHVLPQLGAAWSLKSLIQQINFQVFNQRKWNGNANSKRYLYPMFTAALFIIVRIWKQSKCPLMDEWISRMWDIQNVRYTHTHKNIIQPWKRRKSCYLWQHDGPWGHYAKRNKTKKDKYCIVLLICRI